MMINVIVKYVLSDENGWKSQGVRHFMLDVEDTLMDGNVPSAGGVNQSTLAGQCWFDCVSKLMEEDSMMRAMPQSILVNGVELL